MSLNLDHSTWKRVAFGDIASASKERCDPTDGSVDRYIAGEHMDTDELKIRRWGDVGDGYLGPAFHRAFHPGQVLYGSRRTYLRKVAVAEFDGVCANTTFVVESKDTKVLLPEFLPFVMTSEPFHSFAIAESKGSVNPYVNWSDIANYEFDLPPVDDQKRIADLLWAVEDEREGTTGLFRALTDLRNSLIDTRFLRAEEGSLADLCPKDGIRIGPFGAQLHTYDYVEDGGCPVVMPQDMVDGQISVSKIRRVSAAKAEVLSAHRLRAGDILLPRRGELDRRALVTEQEDGWLCGTGSVRIRVRAEVPVRAVYLALSSSETVDWLRANAVGTTMPNLNSGIVERIPISIPERATLEETLVAVDHVDVALDKALARREAAHALAISVSTEVFGGSE